jgi:hypothetical protein
VVHVAFAALGVSAARCLCDAAPSGHRVASSCHLPDGRFAAAPDITRSATKPKSTIAEEYPLPARRISKMQNFILEYNQDGVE